MAMAAYLVTLSAGAAAATLKAGANAQIVWAASEAQAKEVAGATFDGDANIWSDATATEITSDADLEGWTFKIVIQTAVPKVFAYVGTAANNTMAEVASALVTLINADADIAGAAYAANVLKVAETTDGLGDKVVTVEAIPPGGFGSVPSLVGAITCSGAAGDALTVAFPATMDSPPAAIAYGKV